MENKNRFSSIIVTALLLAVTLTATTTAQTVPELGVGLHVQDELADYRDEATHWSTTAPVNSAMGWVEDENGDPYRMAGVHPDVLGPQKARANGNPYYDLAVLPWELGTICADGVDPCLPSMMPTYIGNGDDSYLQFDEGGEGNDEVLLLMGSDEVGVTKISFDWELDGGGAQRAVTFDVTGVELNFNACTLGSSVLLAGSVSMSDNIQVTLWGTYSTEGEYDIFNEVHQVFIKRGEEYIFRCGSFGTYNFEDVLQSSKVDASAEQATAFSETLQQSGIFQYLYLDFNPAVTKATIRSVSFPGVVPAGTLEGNIVLNPGIEGDLIEGDLDDVKLLKSGAFVADAGRGGSQALDLGHSAAITSHPRVNEASFGVAPGSSLQDFEHIAMYAQAPSGQWGDLNTHGLQIQPIMTIDVDGDGRYESLGDNSDTQDVCVVFEQQSLPDRDSRSWQFLLFDASQKASATVGACNGPGSAQLSETRDQVPDGEILDLFLQSYHGLGSAGNYPGGYPLYIDDVTILVDDFNLVHPVAGFSGEFLTPLTAGLQVAVEGLENTDKVTVTVASANPTPAYIIDGSHYTLTVGYGPSASSGTQFCSGILADTPVPDESGTIEFVFDGCDFQNIGAYTQWAHFTLDSGVTHLSGDGLDFTNERQHLYASNPFGAAWNTVDRDDDGTWNAEDNCPNIPNGDQFDEDNDSLGDACDNGDTDDDGVLDSDDNCPGTESSAEVDDYGCSYAQRDDDGDGVSNADEERLGTDPLDKGDVPQFGADVVLPNKGSWAESTRANDQVVKDLNNGKLKVMDPSGNGGEASVEWLGLPGQGYVATDSGQPFAVISKDFGSWVSVSSIGVTSLTCTGLDVSVYAEVRAGPGSPTEMIGADAACDGADGDFELLVNGQVRNMHIAVKSDGSGSLSFGTTWRS